MSPSHTTIEYFTSHFALSGTQATRFICFGFSKRAGKREREIENLMSIFRSFSKSTKLKCFEWFLKYAMGRCVCFVRSSNCRNMAFEINEHHLGEAVTAAATQEERTAHMIETHTEQLQTTLHTEVHYLSNWCVSSILERGYAIYATNYLHGCLFIQSIRS